MSPFTLFGFLVFLIVSSTVGIRLLWLWARTRQAPELLIATGVLGIGPVGFGFSIAAGTLAETQPGLAQVLWAIAFFTMSLGAATCYGFTWLVFRRDAPWAQVGLTIAVWAFAVMWVAEGLGAGWMVEQGNPSAVYQASAWLRIGAMTWASLESFRYWRLMRRRAALGMANPMVTNRFFLWGVGIGAAGLGSAIATVATAVTGAQPDWVTLSSSLHGLAAAIGMWLAFVPPAAYRRWVAGPAAASA